MKRGFAPVHGVALALGLVFLYAPIVLLAVYSFNESRLATLWGGWSLRWYRGLPENRALIEAAWTSLRIGIAAATLATAVGTLTGIALDRLGRFAGRWALGGLVALPLVLPEAILGLALLLTFIALGIERGQGTVILAHAVLAVGYVALVVQARLALIDPRLEEAARDLGCPPLKTLAVVTLPLLWPAIMAGWLLALVLSLDDLVLASFASGPGSTTLPMRIFSQARLGVTPEINAIATLLIGVVAATVLLASVLIKGTAGRR